MTGPAVDRSGPSEVGFSEMESQLQEIETGKLKSNLDEIKLDAEDVPENLKGKTARDVLNYVKSVEESLRVSETARQQALATAQLASQRVGEAPKPPAPPAKKVFSKEELKEMYDNDPLAAIEAMQSQAIDIAAEHFSRRIEPMIVGSQQTAEQQARQKYPDEFEVFEKEIKEVVANLPDPGSLSNLSTWDNIVTFARGKDYMRLVNHQAARERTKSEAAALENERNNVGFSPGPQRRAPAPKGKVVLDATSQEIARNLGMTDEDYIKWGGSPSGY